MKKTHFKLPLFISLITLILLLSYFGFTKTPVKKTLPQTTTKEFVQYKEQILTVGGKQAYQEFKKKNQLLKTNIQHNFAHVFGEALYSSLGLSGIRVCDSDFNYGCYHSVIGNALAREGLEKVAEINQQCSSTTDFLKCQHGIGHGIIAYLGYEYDNLEQALTICDSLKNRDHIGGCFTGIFMEYNFQTMLSEDAKVRHFDEKSPLYPCNKLAVNFQDPCFYEQANWWLQVLPGDLKQKTIQIDQYCRDLPGGQRDACYSGLGIHYPSYTNWNSKASLAGCLLIQDRNSQLLCIYGVASDFSSRSGYSNQTREICNSLESNEKMICIKRAGIL